MVTKNKISFVHIAEVPQAETVTSVMVAAKKLRMLTKTHNTVYPSPLTHNQVANNKENLYELR